MDFDRRHVLRLTGITGVGAATASALASPTQAAARPSPRSASMRLISGFARVVPMIKHQSCNEPSTSPLKCASRSPSCPGSIAWRTYAAARAQLLACAERHALS